MNRLIGWIISGGLIFNSLVCIAETTDEIWEKRISNRLVQNVDSAEVIWCDVDSTSFLTLFTQQSSERAQGAAVILHAMGAHPDWPDVINPIRLKLAEQGWSTLSIQLPLLMPQTPVGDYGKTMTEASKRLQAVIKLLREKKFLNIVVIGHGFGATSAALALANNPQLQVTAFVGIGMQNHQFLVPPVDLLKLIELIKLPVLDIYGSRDYSGVLEQADDRRLAAQKSGNRAYQQIVIDGADHQFAGLEPVLIKRIRSWLDKAAPGVAVMVDKDFDTGFNQTKDQESESAE